MSEQPGAGREAVTVDAPQAVSGKAVMIVRQHLINNGATIPVDVIREALEAAAPHLAAAERLRLAGDIDLTRIEPDPDQPGYNRGVFDVTAAAAQAAVRERERCAQLAEQHGATGSKCAKGIAPNPSSDCWCRAARPRFPFAALLRRGGESGAS